MNPVGRCCPSEAQRAHLPARAATVVTPSGRQEPPPPLAESYPQADRPASSRWGTSMDMLLPAATPADETMRSHKIVDGDTLAALAQRYLGSAARAEEIFKANRDVLDDPELLPIGAELKIPPRGSGPAGATSLPPDPSTEPPGARPLVLSNPRHVPQELGVKGSQFAEGVAEFVEPFVGAIRH